MATPELATTLVVSQDDRLLQAEALVRTYCGWHIAPNRTDTVVLQGNSLPTTLFLPSLYVTAITAVSWDALVQPSTNYWWTTAGTLTVPLRDAWTCPTAVTVTFSHGYDTPPPDVTAVVQAVAQRAVDNPASMTSQTAGPFNAQYAGVAVSGTAVSLLASEKAALAAYRIPAAT